ncbi:MAG: Radical SAM protein, partial [uncultured bacterium]
GKDYRACGTSHFLSLDNIETIFNHLDMRQLVDVIYGGGGEPYLNPDLGKIALFTRRSFFSLQHTVITNAIDLQEKTTQDLLDAGVHFLVSVNAATASTYKDVSGVDGFAHVIGNLRRLFQQRERRASHINLSMILMRRNIEELPAFIDLAADLGADAVKVMYSRIYPAAYREKQGRNRVIADEDSLFYHQELSDSMVGQAVVRAREKKIEFHRVPFFHEKHQVRERDCTEPWRSLFINFNGDVYPCPASEILFRPKIDDGKYQSGNILKQHYKEFWNNRFWQELRRTNAAHGRMSVVPECLCCGGAICWEGPCKERNHVLNWTEAERSDLRL